MGLIMVSPPTKLSADSSSRIMQNQSSTDDVSFIFVMLELLWQENSCKKAQQIMGAASEST